MAIWLGGESCSTPQSLYCVQIDRTVTVAAPTPPTNHRIAFTTQAAFTLGGGITAADALCATEATAAGRSGSFKALLPVTGATAASRFSTSGGPWARVDGATIFEPVANTFTTNHWDTAPNLSADGKQYVGNADVWGGLRSLTAVGDDGTTCSSWTVQTGSTGSGRPGMTQLSQLLAYDGSSGCANHFKLICLQE